MYTFPQDNSENPNMFLYHLLKTTANKNYKIQHIDLRNVPRFIHVKYFYPGPLQVIEDIPGMGYKNVTSRIFEYIYD